MSGINLGKMWGPNQGPTGRRFQLRDGSDSSIGTTFFSIGYYRVLKILIGYFSFTSVIRYFLFGSTMVLAALGRWTLVHVWLVQPMCWNCLAANVYILPICIVAGTLLMFSCVARMCASYPSNGVYQEMLSLGKYFPIPSQGSRECIG